MPVFSLRLPRFSARQGAARGVRRGLLGAAALAATTAAAMMAAGAPAAVANESLSGQYLAAYRARALDDFEAAGRYYRRALNHAPNDPQLLSDAMLYTLAAGDGARAATLARRLETVGEPGVVVALLLAADALRRDDYADAQRRIETGATPSALLRGLMLGWAQHGAGAYEDAEATLTALEGDPGWPLAVYHLGLMRHARGAHEAAVSAYEDALRAGASATPRFVAAHGAALRAAGRTEEAADIFTVALAEAPENLTLRRSVEALEAGAPAPGWGRPLTPAQGTSDAFQSIASLIVSSPRERVIALSLSQIALHLDQDNAPARLLSASILERFGQGAAAAAAYAQVSPLNDLYVTAQLGKAGALERLEHFDDALAVLEPLRLGAEQQVEVLFAIGDVHSRAEQYQDCAEAYGAGLALVDTPDRRFWPAYFTHGVCLERIGSWPAAEAAFRRALDFEPEQPDVLNYLGYSLLDMGVRLDEAQDMIERAVAARPDSGYIVDSLGWLFFQRGEYERAVVELERAAELTPIEAVINDHLGDALWMVGRRFEAEFQWRRALSMDPDEKDRTRILRKLDVGLDKVRAEEKAAEAAGSTDGAAAEEAAEEAGAVDTPSPRGG